MELLKQLKSYITNCPIILTDGHTYWDKFKDEPIYLPSVTRIVQDMLGKDYSRVPDDVLAKAIKRGTALHEYLDSHFSGRFDKDDNQPELTGYIFEWLARVDSMDNPLECLTEVPFKNNTMIGQIDCLAVVDDEL